MTRLDVNKDSCISRKDFELMSKRLSEHSRMTKEQAESAYKEFMKVADALKFKPGVKISIKEAAQQASKAILATSLEEIESSSMASTTYYLI